MNAYLYMYGAPFYYSTYFSEISPIRIGDITKMDNIVKRCPIHMKYKAFSCKKCINITTQIALTLHILENLHKTILKSIA
jgi:hypothetical protein